VGRDSGLDLEKITAPEREMAGWRDSDVLPFPLTPEPLAARIADTLDYPPKGQWHSHISTNSIIVQDA
jgi:hypothetical protein